MLRGRVLRGAALAFIATFAVACQPVTHPTFTVKESPAAAAAAAKVTGLSGDGNFATVESTAAGATVPGPGTWRVDRRDGSVSRLPGGYTVERINRTGDRVLLDSTSDSHVVLWMNGTVVEPRGVMSDQLTFGLFADSQGKLQRWEAATGAVSPVETGVPRPPGYGANPVAISDDGRVAEFEMRSSVNSDGIWRMVDIAHHTVTDVAEDERPNHREELRMAAGDGSAFAVWHLENHPDFSFDPPRTTNDVDWVELRDRATGAVRRHHDVPLDEDVGRVAIAANGASAWVLQTHTDYNAACGSGPVYPIYCIDRSEAVVVLASGVHSFAAGGGWSLGSVRSTPSGRFLAVDYYARPGIHVSGPTTVVDWVARTTETLGRAVNRRETDRTTCQAVAHRAAPCDIPASSTAARLSDDGKVVVTTTDSGSGWYEYTPASK